MNRHGSLSTGMIFSVLAAIVFCSGCRDKAGSQGGPAASRKKPGPAESFDLIYETFRRGIETGANGVPGSFVANEASSRTRLTVNNSVSKELIPPTNADEPYRAKITVVSKSNYSLMRADEEDDKDSKQPEREQPAGFDPLNSAGPTDGVNVLDPELISGGQGAAGERDDIITDPVGRRHDEVERTYELVYRGGRWELLTKLDEETEQSIKSAFNTAFKTQI